MASASENSLSESLQNQAKLASAFMQLSQLRLKAEIQSEPVMKRGYLSEAPGSENTLSHHR